MWWLWGRWGRVLRCGSVRMGEVGGFLVLLWVIGGGRGWWCFG